MKGMKKILLIVLSLSMSCTLTFSQISLKFNPAKGDKYQYYYEIEQDIQQSVGGQQIPLKQKIVTVYDMNILDGGSNDTKIAFTYKTIAYEMSSPMGSMIYHSDNLPDNPSPTEQTMRQVFGSLLNKQFEVVVQKDGTVKSVTGMDEVLSSMAEAIGKNNPQSAMMVENLKQQFSDEAMKNNFEQS